MDCIWCEVKGINVNFPNGEILQHELLIISMLICDPGEVGKLKCHNCVLPGQGLFPVELRLSLKNNNKKSGVQREVNTSKDILSPTYLWYYSVEFGCVD